jgi:pimeloyl-ACP methyl ester carboxylesterase
LLIDYLPAYIFPKSEHHISDHLALGVSLGGHATWSCLFHEPRISTGVVIIGCPDYVNLLSDRARLSKRESWVTTNPPGSRFLGSADFPTSLLETVRRYDPAGLVLAHMRLSAKDVPLKQVHLPDPSEQEIQELRMLLSRTIGGKRILNISGGVDKLVPYACGEPFLTWLKKAIVPGGWFSDGGMYFEDLIFNHAAHELNAGMVDEVIRFVGESLTVPQGSKTSVMREAKI